MPVVANFGGGVNGTAMLIEAVRRGEPVPTAILFADTRAERAATYVNLERLEAWLVERGWPPVTVVDNYVRPDGTSGPHISLEAECLTNQTLPGLAYGHRGCSRKWKIQPMDRWIAAQPWARDAWSRGEKVVRWIGYDAGESHRGLIPEDDKFTYRYPLVEWGMGRAECIAAIRAVGLPVPPKSACFFCPAMTKREVLGLKRERPDLFDRAVAIERAAAPNNCSVAGLGRHWSWERIAAMDEAQLRLFPDAGVEPCIICWDGAPEEDCE